MRLTADNHAVICHGHRFASTTIAKATAGRLRVLPLLEDVLERYASRAFLDIELKVPGIESHLVNAISKFPLERGYVVSSFLPTVLINLRNLSPTVPLGIICETRKQLSIWRDLPVQYVIAHERLITPELLRDAHSDDKAVFAWTINKKASMIRLGNSGVDGIVSDKTDLLVATLRGPD